MRTTSSFVSAVKSIEKQPSYSLSSAFIKSIDYGPQNKFVKHLLTTFTLLYKVLLKMKKGVRSVRIELPEDTHAQLKSEAVLAKYPLKDYLVDLLNGLVNRTTQPTKKGK